MHWRENHDQKCPPCHSAGVAAPQDVAERRALGRSCRDMLPAKLASPQEASQPEDHQTQARQEALLHHGGRNDSLRGPVDDGRFIRNWLAWCTHAAPFR